MDNVSLKIKLYSLAGILLAFMLFSTVVSITKMSEIGGEITAVAEQDIPLTEIVSKVTINQLGQAINFERILRYGEDMQENKKSISLFNHEIEKFNEHADVINTAINEGEKIALQAINNAHNEKDKKEFEHVNQILEKVEDELEGYKKHVSEIIAEVKKGNIFHALELAEKTEIEEAKIDRELESLLLELESFTKEATLQAKHDEESALRLLLIIAVISVIVGAAISTFIIRNLVKSIKSAVDIAETISTGDLTHEVTSHGNDEMGKLLSALGLMRNNLYKMVVEMTDSSTQLAAASTELAAVSEETNRNIHAQQAEVEQAATAINEMTTTIHEVAQNASNTSVAADSANKATVEGQQVVKQTVQSISELASDIENASGVIHELELHSENIGGVLDVIKNIAEQTNLLALNAAIEAARAGEQGRGFAVVADEVRTLASRTQESTQEIEMMIDKLQSGAQNAVKVMENSRGQAATSVEQANSAGTALLTITESVAHISDMNTQIATAAEEQSSVAEEINRNIISVSDLGNQTAAGANQTSISSEELSRLATDLQSLVSQFKV
jgi:methyl-accepting chemotaxis protein